jgi:hypothetical protein
VPSSSPGTPPSTTSSTAHTTTSAHIISAGSPTPDQGGSWLPWVVIGVVAALVAGGIGYRYYRRRRSLPPTAP